MADVIEKGDYKQTETYKNADGAYRAKIERYRKENKIENNQMYLILLREDYRNLPKEEKQKGNRIAEIMVISGIITFLIMTANNRRDLLPYAAVYMLVVTVVYFSGILNPVARQLSNIRKLLKKFPEVPDFRAYMNDNEES